MQLSSISSVEVLHNAAVQKVWRYARLASQLSSHTRPRTRPGESQVVTRQDKNIILCLHNPDGLTLFVLQYFRQNITCHLDVFIQLFNVGSCEFYELEILDAIYRNMKVTL